MGVSQAARLRALDRSPAQFAGSALRFFLSLPRDARVSLAALENLGTEDERRQAMNEMARSLNIAELDMTRRRMAEHAATLVPEDADEAAFQTPNTDILRSGQIQTYRAAHHSVTIMEAAAARFLRTGETSG